MERMFVFIKRRWFIFVLLFFTSSLSFYNLAEKKELYYKAEADIAFVGKEGSFNLALAAKRLQDKDFLADISSGAGPLVADLKKNLTIDFKDKNTITVSFISQAAAQTREVVFKICDQFTRERSTLVKRLKDKEGENKRRLRQLADAAAALKNDLNLIKQKFNKLKTDNSRADKERSGLEEDLAKLSLQKEDLLKVFTEKHPDVITLTDKIDSLKERIASLPDNAPLYRKFIAAIEKKEQELRLKERECEDFRTNLPPQQEYWYAEVIERPSSYPVPLGQKRQWYHKWGTVAAFIISILGSIIADILDKSIYAKKEAERRLRAPIACEIKKATLMKKGLFRRNRSTKTIFSRVITSRALKDHDRLYSFLKMDVFKGQLDKKTIIISSAEPATGKSYIASCLALVAAKNGNKTLLIDMNLRYPSIHIFFGFKDSSNGVSDILRQRSAKESAIISLTDLLLSGDSKLSQENLTGLDNLKVLLSGTRVENPLEILGGSELAGLLKELSQTYGLLIIDTCALKNYTDALNIMPLAEAVILIERKGKSSCSAAEDAIYRIKNVGGALKGLVLTNV